ncbi:MAG TPA: ElyC/SanA/YdcF family protein [Desulfobacteraceae bacterium]|nr:ElyC/SanA/YdcF family protein [Desulfobacteraceae bacterium]
MNSLCRYAVRSAIVIALCAFLVVVGACSESFDIRSPIKHWLEGKLVVVNSLPSSATVDASYVLGGSPRSLEYKFRTIADCYRKGMCKTILILSRPGITEYSSSLGRNLTNNEWSILKLKIAGVSEKDIELVDMEPGFFGTLTEAKHISRLAERRGYESLMLVTAPYHTKRVKATFAGMLRNKDITVLVRGSAERHSLFILVVEFIKLTVYQYLLI